jgi:hypothetical protein
MPGPGTWSAGDILTAGDLNAIGTWTSYTPVLAQNGTRTATVNYAQYMLLNKMCVVNVDLTCTQAGSAGSQITVTYPFTAAGNTLISVGSGFFYDDSATDIILLTVLQASTTTVSFRTEDGTSPGAGFGQLPSLALANDDVISFSIVYRVA